MFNNRKSISRSPLKKYRVSESATLSFEVYKVQLFIN